MSKYYSVEQAAKKMGITPKKARDLAVKGILPTMIFGKEYVIAKKALDYYLKKRKK